MPGGYPRAAAGGRHGTARLHAWVPACPGESRALLGGASAARLVLVGGEESAEEPVEQYQVLAVVVLVGGVLVHYLVALWMHMALGSLVCVRRSSRCDCM